MTAYNSTDNNVVFFFVSDLKIVQLLILYHHALDKREQIFYVSTYLETKSFKTVQTKCHRKFNFNNYLQKSQIYRWSHKFQAKGSVNNCNMKADNPTSDRKLTERCPDYMRDSFGRSPKKFLQRRSKQLGLLCASLQRILKKDLKLYPYRIQIKQNLTPADMEFLVSVVNRYHINELHLFSNTLYIKYASFVNGFFVGKIFKRARDHFFDFSFLISIIAI